MPVLIQAERTFGLRRALLVTGLLVAVDTLGAQQPCTNQWGPIQSLLASSGAPAYVDAPTQLGTDGARLLIGSPAFVWAAHGAFMPRRSGQSVDSAATGSFLLSHHLLAGFELRRDGRVEPVPAPGWPAAPSYLLAASDGVVAHLMWTSAAPGIDDNSSRTRMWTSELAGRQWSRPILLWAARLIYPRVSAVALVSHGNPVVLVPVVDSARGSGILFARRIAGEWRADVIRDRGLPSYVTALPLGADSLLVAWVATDPAAWKSNGSHVFVGRIALRDSMWSRSSRVQWSGLGAVRSPALFRLPVGFRGRQRIVLSWATVQPGASAIDSLVSIVSTDDGNSWSVPAAMAVTTTSHAVVWQAGDAGDVHAIIKGRDSDEGTTLLHATWHQQGWRPMDSITVPRLGTQFSLNREAKGELRLSWGSLERAGSPDGSSAPVGLYAIVRTSCK